MKLQQMIDLSRLINAQNSVFLTVLILEECGQIDMTRLAQRLRLSTAAVTGLADRLVENGFVKRLKKPNDRRAIILELTEKGYDILSSLGIHIPSESTGSRDWA